ncbi:gamma-glutamyl-gamma-aminobutyrate hydrolase family protein, partial [uncultured Pseudomonas sp.]|uniref:gamma-glutamyl-gamma-aminobutyrate hydrolase family protein n=1 Tax=uncultured Pseudomonas sp. TaxID=114707 RepID=UPI002587F927
REPQSELLAEQYAPTHPVIVPPGGVFERLGLPASFQVNSLHSQGIARLAPGLRIEAQAPDGLVEGVSLANAPGFVVGVQWHPEWNFRDNPESLALLDAFRDACQRHAAAR